MKYAKKYDLGGDLLTGAAMGASVGTAFGPGIGTAIGAGLGATAYAIAGSKRRKIEATENQIAIDNIIKQQKQMKLSNDIVRNNSFSTYGTNTGYYAMGGVKPINSNMGIAVGDTHQQDTDGDGKTGVPFKGAEVENNEVTYSLPDKDLIFSDRILTKDGVTFAAKAATLGAVKASIESKMSTHTDTQGRGTNARQKEKAASIDKQVLELFEEQESLKAPQQEQNQEGTPQFSLGGAASNAVYRATNGKYGSPTSYGWQVQNGSTDTIDGNKVANSVTNALSLGSNLYDLTVKRPRVPDARLLTYTPLETKVNVDSQVNTINSNADLVNKDILNNTANSNNAIGRVKANRVSQVEQLNKVYENKNNSETALRNQNIIGQNAVDNANTDRLAKGDWNIFDSTVEKQNQLSKNLYNLRTDARTMMKDENQANLDNQKIYYNSFAARGNDAALFNMYDTFKNSLSDDQFRTWLKSQGNTSLINRYNLDNPKNQLI